MQRHRSGLRACPVTLIDYLFITCRQAVGPEVRRGLPVLWLGALLPLGARAQLSELGHS